MWECHAVSREIANANDALMQRCIEVVAGPQNVTVWCAGAALVSKIKEKGREERGREHA